MNSVFEFRTGGRWAARALGVLLLATLMSTPVAASAEESFDGTWVFAGGESQRAALRRSIEEVVNRMNVLIRPIARSRMVSRIFVAPRLGFTSSDEGLLIRHEPLPPRLVRPGASPLLLTNRTGEHVSVMYRIAPNRITEVISHGRSSRTNEYRLEAGGRVLVLCTTIRSNMLPSAVRFELRYRRG